ncbi:carbohydrate ABC transporter permease [Lachnospiraceae bacterium MD308]|nr:carbohydrate ABC transporter permease [Lachnospiraceae bacterium MD308]MCI8579849.1 carbohydrate ABC transporter permease [Dorea sp.]
MVKRKIRALLIRIVLAALLIFMVMPLIMLCTNSLMGKQELMETCGAVLSDYGTKTRFSLFPQYPTLQAYVRLLLDSPEYFKAFWNSAILSVGVLAGQLLITVPAAWAFARFEFPGKSAVRFLYILLLLLPFQVTMVSGYLVLDTLKLLDTYLAVILPGVFSALPMFILSKSFAAIPKETIEAAKIDGAGNFCIFARIGIPLGMPGIFSVLVLGFLEYWNAVEQPLTYLKTETLKPLSLYLPMMVKEEIRSAFAASIITLLPAVLLFLCGRESLEKGIAASGSF